MGYVDTMIQRERKRSKGSRRTVGSPGACRARRRGAGRLDGEGIIHADGGQSGKRRLDSGDWGRPSTHGSWRRKRGSRQSSWKCQIDLGRPEMTTNTTAATAGAQDADLIRSLQTVLASADCTRT